MEVSNRINSKPLPKRKSSILIILISFNITYYYYLTEILLFTIENGDIVIYTGKRNIFPLENGNICI